MLFETNIFVYILYITPDSVFFYTWIRNSKLNNYGFKTKSKKKLTSHNFKIAVEADLSIDYYLIFIIVV
jgi:hypothetical protein